MNYYTRINRNHSGLATLIYEFLKNHTKFDWSKKRVSKNIKEQISRPQTFKPFEID